MKTQTKTPWQSNGSNIYGTDPDRAIVCMVPLVANRDFIVMACNNFDRLITALEYCAAGPGELRPENQAQYLVARKALAEVKS